MKSAYIKYAILGLAFLSGFFSLLFSLQQDYIKMMLTSGLLLVLTLAYHLLFCKCKNRFLINVLGFFIISYAVRILGNYFPDKSQWFLHAGNFLALVAIGMILIKILKNTKALLVVKKYMWLMFLIIAIDAYIIYEITGLIVKFNLSFNHLFIGFSSPIIKLIVLSAGVIYYLANADKYWRASFLLLAACGYFLQDVVESINFLWFTHNTLPVLTLLSTGFYIASLWMLYLYSTKPNVTFEG